MNKKGVTLIELLITIVLFLIMISALYITVSTLYFGQSREREKSLILGDINTTVLIIDKLIRSTGFGVDKKKLKEAIKIDNGTLTFRTLLGFDTLSGLWEICPDSGERGSKYPAVVLSMDKKYLKTLDENELNCSPGTIIIKCKDNGTECDDPYYYEHTLSLGSTASTLDKCFSNTGSLLLDGNRPILHCVYDFRVEYDENTKLLKVGFLIQKGKREKKKLIKNYDYNILTNKTITVSNDDFYYYRWENVEEMFFLENLK